MFSSVGVFAYFVIDGLRVFSFGLLVCGVYIVCLGVLPLLFSLLYFDFVAGLCSLTCV